MSEFLIDFRVNRWWWGLRQVALHVTLTVLALGIAFSLPVAAQYILYQWWPRVAADAGLLLVSEISLAASLVVLFNMWRVASVNRLKGRVADAASLVYARHRSNWFTRWRERSLIRRLPSSRDACILTLTGYDTFADGKSLLREPLLAAYEIRVMLLDPAARSAEKRVSSLPEGITQQSYSEEVQASIAYLGELRTLGKKVTLKFYESEPFWKIVVLGDHVWVQYCHSGFEVKSEPEYVFAHNPDNPRLGLYVPFYMYFLEQWNDARHPRYDFDTRELVYYDGLGREIRRAGYNGGKAHVPALLHSPPAPCPPATASGHESSEMES